MKAKTHVLWNTSNIKPPIDLVVDIGVCQDVGLNGLEKSEGLFFTSLNLLLLDLAVAFGVVLAAALHDGSSITGGNYLGLVTDFLNRIAQTVSLKHGVAVFAIFLVELINPLLHILVLAP